ncbi:SDR family oxidoreductase [Hwanghaeella grinnelliae]|uniref:SDR family oxidoreductase n=1 Tax=Hwanghaeella grinnelliae TaxID=2500179 RepID=A0A3S3UMT6_9PROT|nr:SDR family oxidoreductase [Hwanghaeella grinnelliae]RVU35187.1 SDR family oxidoreductase [Hwanghaeella grinnelliae]
MGDRPVIIVTGAGRGIGAAIAIKAAEAGYDVVINYAGNAEAAKQTSATCEAAGAKAITVQADVAKQEGVETVFKASDEAFGRLDAVVTNAGITGVSSKLVDADPEMIERVIDLNVTGALLTAREGAARMMTSRGGKGGNIVNLSSASVWIGSPNDFVWYATSKGSIDVLTLGLSRELAGEGIRVNAVAPGLIDTEIHASAGIPDRIARLGSSVPIGRAGTAEEVADAVLYLMSEQASYVTGTVLKVAGGR